MYMEFADIDWIAGDYGGDYTDRGSVMRSCPILAAVSSGYFKTKRNKTLINININKTNIRNINKPIKDGHVQF